MMFMYKKVVELNTCYGGSCGSSHRKKVFLRAKRLRFQVLFILVSGLHPPLSLITYCIKTNRGHFQNKGDSQNEEICYFNFLVQKKINFLFLYLMFSQEHLPIALCQFLFLTVDFWIKKYMFRYIKSQDGKEFWCVLA